MIHFEIDFYRMQDMDKLFFSLQLPKYSSTIVRKDYLFSIELSLDLYLKSSDALYGLIPTLSVLSH